MDSDDLILRWLQGRASPGEARGLEQWRRADPANERRFSALEELWRITWVLDAPHDPRARPDPDDLITRADCERRAELKGPAREKPGPSVRWGRHLAKVAIAAGIAAVGLGVGGLIATWRGDEAPLAANVITTGTGELTTVSLVDGTNIRVGPLSTLRFAQEGKDRVAYLEGKAFFGVHSDRGRRFRVRTAEGEAVVFGTRFEVSSENDELRVLVVDGTVRVSSGGAEADIRKGEMSRSRLGHPPSKRKVSDIYSYLDWMGNAVVFQNTPLKEAIQEIERRYHLDVRLDDPKLADLGITMTLNEEDEKDVILVLCEVVDAHCSIDGNRVLIAGKAPSPPQSQ